MCTMNPWTELSGTDPGRDFRVLTEPDKQIPHIPGAFLAYNSINHECHWKSTAFPKASGVMKKRNNYLASELKDSVVRAFDLPPDLAYGSILLSVTGQNEILIENYRGILEYKDDRIRIQAKDCRILIIGKRLDIEYYTNDEMKIKGFIEQIIYEK